MHEGYGMKVPSDVGMGPSIREGTRGAATFVHKMIRTRRSAVEGKHGDSQPGGDKMRFKSNVTFTLFGFLLWTAMGLVLADDLSIYGDGLQKEFSDVVFITTDELARSLPASSTLLIDVREPEEFEVSRLPGAVLAGKPLAAWLERLDTPKDKRLVVYCSVGYRSAILARELQKAGFTHVFNLKGSIFAWANEGRPLENSDGAVDGVHPFNKRWGRFLEKSQWKWSP